MPDDIAAIGDAVDAVSRAVDPSPTEPEIDLTTTPVTWRAPGTGPGVGAEPATVPAGRTSTDLVPVAVAAPSDVQRPSVVGLLAGVAAALLILLLASLLGVLFNRVDDLEQQLESGRATTASVRPVQQQVDALQEQVAELQATVGALEAAPGVATGVDVTALTTRLDAVVACVNASMEPVTSAQDRTALAASQPC